MNQILKTQKVDSNIMIKILFILLVCYMPILGNYLPNIDFGSGIPAIGPARVSSYLLLFVFAIEFVLKKQARLFSKWAGFIIVFSIVVLASVSWSNYSYSFSLIQAVFDSVLFPLAIAIIGLNLFTEKDNIDAFIKNILIAAFILSLISIYQFLSSGAMGIENIAPTEEIGRELRSSGTFGKSNALAIFIVLVIPCLIYAVEMQLVSKKIGWMLSALLVLGIICTLSRKGMATCILAFLLYYYLKGKFKKIAVMGVVFVIAALTLSGYAVFSHRFSQENIDKNITGRGVMTYAGWQMFKSSPLTGLGYEGYRENFGKYFPWSGKDKYDAHNIFITALANYGLLGFIPFLGIFLYPLSVARKTLKIENDENPHNIKKELAIVCISSVIPFMLNGWFAGGLFKNQILVGLLYTNISLFLSKITK